LARFDWYPVYVQLAVLIYWLGIRGYLVSRTAPAPAKTRVSHAMLPQEMIEQTVTALRIAMEKDKLYLDPALNVSLLAGYTGMSPKNISAVLNQQLHKSFNEFVNEYRVLAIKERLLDGGTQQLTIAGLAYEGGFNSLPTFQRAFKTILGQTPKEFLSKKVNVDRKTGQIRI